MMKVSDCRALIGLCLLACLAGCSDLSASESAGEGGSAGVVQGGAQDFGLFRDILDRGEIPGPGTLDELGFFAEHKIELPEADCGEDLCIHGQLGVMGNMITGSNCTMVLIGLNTPLNPDDFERPPLDLVVSVDVSGSMAGERLSFLKQGLSVMLPALQEGDLVTLIAYRDRAEIVAERVPIDDAATLNQAIEALQAAGSTNIYDGLRTAFEHYDDPLEGFEQRVILLSDGQATAGILEEARILRLASAYSARGVGLTTIGVGDDFDVSLMRTLSEAGAGNHYFLEDPRAVLEVFAEEVNTFLVPIARDVEIELAASSGYKLRRVHGTRLWGFEGRDAIINIPGLFIASRRQIEDGGLGRRGGGGAILAELIPLEAASEVPTVGDLSLSWRQAQSAELQSATVTIDSPLAPGETPADGLFEAPSVEKAFVMLNIFVGFEMAVDSAAAGNLGGALRILQSLDENVAQWLTTNPDTDIEDDKALITLFMANLRANGALDPPLASSPEPWPRD